MNPRRVATGTAGVLLGDNGVTESKVLYSDATVKYFSKEHLPYAMAAILILIFFVLSPALLFLFYPTKLFRKCSSDLEDGKHYMFVLKSSRDATKME